MTYAGDFCEAERHFPESQEAMLNPYQPHSAKIIEVKDQTKSVKLFRLEPTDKKILNFQPGQFVLVSIPGFGEAPFVPCGQPKQDILELCVRQAGTVTTKLHSLIKEDEIYLRGPYGKGFDINNLKDKNLLLIAGGIGLIPLRPVIQWGHSPDLKIQVFIGAKTINDLLFKDEYEEWKKQIDCQITLDEKCSEWTGCIGKITELFKQTKIVENSVAWLCGPPIMYKFVLEKLKELNFKDEDIYLSLERRMQCGLGICQHCAIGSKYVCKDGPVFKYSEIKSIPGVI